MLIKATLRPAPDAFGASAVAGVLALYPTALNRGRRADRRARTLGFLRDPGALDALLPGLSRLAPGPANDRLRALRYATHDLGRAQLRVDERDLRAALVALRVRCWLALHA